MTNKIIGVFACSRPKFWEKFRSQTLGSGKEPLLSSGRTLIGSEKPEHANAPILCINRTKCHLPARSGLIMRISSWNAGAMSPVSLGRGMLCGQHPTHHSELLMIYFYFRPPCFVDKRMNLLSCSVT